ncbi:hypothetical protein B566_EDAN012313 [Ephemera danica]|nr:hypothetical protein B566_EDAN012313 [Ephemera danica]
MLDILEKHPESYKKWPQKLSINTSPSALSSLCVVQEPFKLSSNTSEIFYSESSLRQIVGLLGPDCCDPTVRHSALCQLAVMLLESRLMPAFLETNGVEACIQHLDQALSQDNVMVLSKSVKPIISILCLVAGNHMPSCQSLAQSETVLLNLVRDPRERLVLPFQLVEGLMLPFHAGSYSRVSTHTPANHWHYLRALMDGHSNNLSLLFRCHITLDMIGDIGKTAEAEESLGIAFHSMQAATSHTQVLAALPVLESYLPCVQTQALEWIKTFSRFFTKPPATNDDAILLKAIVILICEHGDLSWLPWHEIILKLDPWQPSTLHTFLPLLLRCSEHLEENVVAKTTIALCQCLLTYEASRDNSILRNILKCLAQLTRLHGVQISSRLMADVMAPLVDITGRFTTRYTSFETISNTEVFIQLLSESHWFDHLACLWEGLHLDEKFTLSLHMDPLIPKSPNEVIKQIVTPDYLAAHYSFLYNLSVASPLVMMDKIIDHGLFTQVLWSLTVCLENKPQNLRPDVCNFIIQTSNLLAYCLITDEKDELAKELHNFPYIAPQLLNIMQFPEFPQVASAVFWLMLTMQQSNHGALFVSAFQEGIFWPPLIAVLKLPEANAGCVKVCELLTVKLQREDTHQAAMAALAGLLAGWPRARRAALKLGLLDSITVAISHCQTGLLTVRDLGQLAHRDKQSHPLVDEIIDSFELLVGLLLNDLKNKTTASQTYLAEEIFKLWPICLVNSRMCLATIKLLAVYTAGCENASTSLLLRDHLVGGVKVKRCASNTSLYHYIVQHVTLELNKAGSPTICLALRILRQSCSSIECRATLTKTSVLQDIFVASEFSCLVGTTQLAVLNFLASFSRHSEGQLAIAKIPEAIESLTIAAMDLKGNQEFNLLSVEILRNLCFCHANRIIVLTSSAILTCFLRLLSSACPKLVQLVATAVWSMAANQHRNKQALKVAGFHQALARARLRCGESSSVVTVIDAALDNLVDS